MGKLVENLKLYLESATEEQLAKDWDELKKYNEVGPNVDTYMQTLLDYKFIEDKNLFVSNMGTPEYSADCDNDLAA